jgi:hypothetical protein
MKHKDDEENYKTIVSKCVLYIKVAKMSDAIYNQLESRFNDEPIIYDFRKVVVKHITIPSQNKVFTSRNLFPDSEKPCKVLFALVYTKSMTGDMTTNPYQFTRKFEKDKTGEKGSIEDENDDEDDEKKEDPEVIEKGGLSDLSVPVTVYIKRFDLHINSASIDQVNKA